MTIATTRRFLLSVALALAYYAAARLGLLLSFEATNVSPVWPPSGIALGALLLFGGRLWPGIFAGACVANFVVFSANGALGPGAALLASLGIAAGNTIEALVGMLVLRRCDGATQLRLPHHAYIFAAVGALAAFCAALVGSGCLLAAGVVPAAALPTVAATWWVGDLAGMLLFAPLMVAWRGPWPPWAQVRSKAPAMLGALLALGAVAALVLARPPEASQRALVFLLLPCVGLASYRYRQRGGTLAQLFIGSAAVLATVSGYGPFSGGTRNDALISLEVFLILSCLVGMVLSADADERERRPGGRRETWQWLVFFGSLLLTVGAWQYIANVTEERAQERFEREVDDVRRRVADRLSIYARVLEGGRASVMASDGVTREGWRDFVGALDIGATYPGVQVLGVARHVRERAALEQEMRAAGQSGFTILPPGQRSDYVAIVFAEPFLGRNRNVLGYDMKSEPNRRTALERAMRSGALAVTGKVKLMQETGVAPQAGFLMYLPYYRRGADTSSTGAREAALGGYVFAAFRMNDLMEGILGNAALGVALDIYDGSRIDPAALMYASTHSRATLPSYQKSIGLAVGDHTWTLQMRSLPAFDASIDRSKSAIVLFGGALITLLLFSTMRALSLTRADALALASSASGALRQSERRFAVLVDSASEFAIIATDLDGVIEVFSVGAESMLGYPAAQLVGRATPALFHDAQEVAARGAELSAELGHVVDGFDVFVCKVSPGQAETRDWTYVRRDGARLPVQLTVNAIVGDDGAVAGFLGIARDIADQKAAERQLRHAKVQAEAGSRAKSEFVANMSHELRTPLNAVLGMTQLLVRGQLSDEQRKDVAVISDSGEALLGIVNDILDFSKIEAGKMTLDRTAFRLDELAAALATTMSLSARERALGLTVALDPALPARVKGDAARLRQVLVNLVGNAIKFTPTGSVAVRLRCASRGESAVGLQVEVSDTGIGMSALHMATLFAPFSQGDTSTTRRFGGTGLGLTISHQLVRLMGGTLEAASIEGAGSTFTMLVELEALADDAPVTVQPWRDAAVLACEGDPASGAVLGETLSALGCRPLLADIAAALSGARVGAEAARVVLLDWALTGADPGALIGAIRAASGAAVVLMLSSFERANASTNLMQLGADYVLDKPITALPLSACLRAVLAPSEAAPSATGDQQCIPSCTLLLVEDHPLNQVVARRLLEGAGARVELADDGSVALEMLRRHPGRYDLVLLDIQMPVMDGFETIAHIRGELALTLPVLAMSAGVMEHERERCIAAGMDGFIAKPINGSQMLAKIARHLPAGAAVGVPPLAAPVVDGGCFNVDALAEHMHDRQASQRILIDLVGKMVDAGTAPLDAMQTAWYGGDRDQAARSMHTLRGSIGSLGAQRFAAAGLTLELALHDGDDAASLDRLLVPVRAELDATLAAASLWLASVPAQPAAPSVHVAPEQLIRLRQLLTANNLAACDLFDQLSAGLDAELGEGVALRLRETMRELDFEAALVLLEQGANPDPVSPVQAIRL
jgi:PAS domain S-box-containing protein